MARMQLPRCAHVGVLVSALFVSPACGAPPRVVETSPAMGDAWVDPEASELRVTFDQPMSPGGRSIVGGGESFPEVTGQPRWEDGGRTFVLPIRVQPGYGYWLSVNSDRFLNFANEAGEPAEPLVVQFRVPGEGELTAEANPANDIAVTALIEAVGRGYSYRDRLGVDWGEVIEGRRDQLARAADADAFARSLSVLLASMQDKHVSVRTARQQYGTYSRPVNANASARLRPRLVPGVETRNQTVSVGRFDDGVGYIAIDSWEASREHDLDAVYEALDEFRDGPGVIIDVRLNGGGDERLAQRVAGCFMSEAQMYAQQVAVDGRGGFGERGLRVVRPNSDWQGEGGAFEGRVAVLAGPATMSSCEAFVLMMKQAPNAAVIGARTQGSSGNPKPHDLGNGVTVYLPSWKAMTAEGVAFEGVGVTPDIAVAPPIQTFDRSDPVLTRALEWVRSGE